MLPQEKTDRWGRATSKLNRGVNIVEESVRLIYMPEDK
uniref:Uncharacterized protein n=1 Tax=Rhizophora mucronata TaxID=61149 RepID=A0A2P2NR19_RHIMU